jgi:hypothetical protein
MMMLGCGEVRLEREPSAQMIASPARIPRLPPSQVTSTPARVHRRAGAARDRSRYQDREC